MNLSHSLASTLHIGTFIIASFYVFNQVIGSHHAAFTKHCNWTVQQCTQCTILFSVKTELAIFIPALFLCFSQAHPVFYP